MFLPQYWAPREELSPAPWLYPLSGKLQSQRACLRTQDGVGHSLPTLTAPLLFLVDCTVSEEPPACPAALSSLKLGDSVLMLPP